MDAYIKRISEVPVLNFLLGFGGIVVLWVFIQGFNQPLSLLNLPADRVWLHLFYSVTAFGILILLQSLLFHLIAGVPCLAALRLIIALFILTLLWPIGDFAIWFATGLVNQAVFSIGMLSQLAVTLFCYFLCLRSLQITPRRSLPLLVAITILYGLWLLVPSTQYFNQQDLLYMYLLLFPLLVMAVLCCVNLPLCQIYVANMRLLRLTYFILLLLLGTATGFLVLPYDIYAQLVLMPDMIYRLLFSLYSLYFASLFVIVINDIADLAIDRVSNVGRPLPSGAISSEQYSVYGYTTLVAAFLYAAMAGAAAFLLIGVCIGSYYIYSVWPWRCKRIFLLSKLVIALNCLAVVMLGYITVVRGSYSFPPSLYLIILLGFTLCANLIDIKDYHGDKQAGIKTLPVLVGMRNAKILTGLAFAFTTLAFYFFLDNVRLIPVLIFAGCMQFYIINKVQDERYILIFNNLCLLGLIGYLLVLKCY